MLIQIESPQFSTTPALNRCLRQRLRDHLAFCSERIRTVEAHFSDVNGRRGGADKRCRLVVRQHRAPEIVVESTEADLYTAIRRAAGRVGRAMRRRIAKQTSSRRPRNQHPADTSASLASPDS